jgi:gamma-glutamyltranspeptidase / glutathione hydrolase
VTGGAVAAGSPFTVEAGVRALELGGNAADAAVAAQLMACVAEPLLTGLGGGGLAMVRMGGRVESLDFFSAMPGLGSVNGAGASMTTIEIDFGPTSQVFHVGPASVAVPGTPEGIWALHERFGRLPMTVLAEPAVEAARKGLPVDGCAEVVYDLLWPIERMTFEAGRLATADGLPLREGDLCGNPFLAPTLEQFAAEGPVMFRTGEAARALVAALGETSRVTLEDLERYRPVFRKPLCMDFRGARVWVPQQPSQGGAMILRSLQALAQGDLPDAFGAEAVDRIAHALHVAELERRDRPVDALFEESFIPAYLGAGYTTHISVVDEDGNAVALTSSLGETCGVCVPETGIRPNNFLGEADVNPAGMNRLAGARLMTMCSPALVSMGDRMIAMGAGGSSRIRSAVLHGVLYLVGHGLSPHVVSRAPRSHVEDGVLKTEIFGRPKEAVDAIRARKPVAVEFEEYGMYFGGLHIAGMGPSGPDGAGDPRRSGAFGSVPRRS